MQTRIDKKGGGSCANLFAFQTKDAKVPVSALEGPGYDAGGQTLEERLIHKTIAEPEQA